MIVVRPLRADDAPGVQQVTEAAFGDYEDRFHEPRLAWTDRRREWFAARVAHFLEHDPGRQHVAVEGERVVGAALASMRVGLWGLSLLVVQPGLQAAGLGRRLIDGALGSHTGRGVICSSQDARAMRRYAAAGFAVHPCFVLTGAPDTASFVRSPAVRDGVDQELADDVDRAVRGSAHGPDHALLRAGRGFGLTFSGGDRRGYCYAGDEGNVGLLAATDEGVATALLEAALIRHAEQGVSATVSHVTGGQQWAVRVALAARLTLAIDGAVCWRGMPEPRAYLPSGALL